MDLKPTPAPLRFSEVPKQLSLEVQVGSYENFCGFVRGADGIPVLVGVFRNRHARPGALYEPPALQYLERAVSVHIENQRMTVGARLPVDDEELRSLVASLGSY